jgi:tetratricopeptide (TPR) repeat protein
LTARLSDMRNALHYTEPIMRAAAPAIRCVAALLMILITAPARASGAAEASIAPAPAAPPTLAANGTAIDTLLRRGMRFNLESDHAAARAVAAQIGTHDASHPAGPFLETQTLYWQMLYDDGNRQHDAAIESACLRTIELAEARLASNTQDADSHFFAGQGYMGLGRLRGLRGHYYSAGKAGEQAREHLETTLKLRPAWVDARHQLGLYYFYASLIPSLVSQWLGWLWFVPMGDADLGISYIRDVSENGDLFRDDAKMILSNIYTYFREEEVGTALEIMWDLRARYPENPLIHFELIETLLVDGRYDETITEAKRLEQKPSLDEGWRGRQTVALVWRARAELMLGRPERSLELLAPLEATPPVNPHWAAAWVDLTRGQALDALGQREKALFEYRAVLDNDRQFGSDRAEALARAAIEAPFTVTQRPELSAAP